MTILLRPVGATPSESLSKLKSQYRDCKDLTDSLRAQLDIAELRARNERGVLSLIKQYFNEKLLSNVVLLNEIHQNLANLESACIELRSRFEDAQQHELNVYEAYSKAVKQIDTAAENKARNTLGVQSYV